jgi:cobalamin-dependent methionine synthase I
MSTTLTSKSTSTSKLNFNIIAEKINDSVPSTHKMFEAEDYEGIIMLAKTQAAEGAAYIDVNIGLRDPKIMSDLITAIQKEVSLPLCIDSPDIEIQKAGLKAYKPELAGGQPPLINSISELRMEFLELSRLQRVKFIALCSERSVDGDMKANETAHQIFETALRLTAAIKEKCPGLKNDDIFIDPGIGPIGADTSGMTNATVESVELINKSEEMKGCHMSVGLSNFSVQLPPRTASGDLVKTPLESAFLTLTNAIGMDHVIGSTKKKYKYLSEDHPALNTVKDVLKLEGFDRLMRVQEFYS